MRTQFLLTRSLALLTKSFLSLFFLMGSWLMIYQPLQAKPIEKSQVSIEGKQMGAITRAEFKKTQGDITLNPTSSATLASAKIKMEIETASLNFSSPLVSAEIKKPEWLNVLLFPKALFESTQITKKSDTELDIQGLLTIKDVKKTIRFPAQFLIKGQKIKLSGEFEFKRLDFGVGKGEWGDTSIVADPVKVRFDILSPL
jgi:polyisoprenoid-binding protein YceI